MSMTIIALFFSNIAICFTIYEYCASIVYIYCQRGIYDGYTSRERYTYCD